MVEAYILYPFSGLVVGTLVGFTGVGGGALMTPILVLFFGLHPMSAVGTDLLFAAMTKIIGTAVHGAKKTVNWNIVFRLASGSIPASIGMIYCLSFVDHNNLAMVSMINILLGILLFITALLLFTREHILVIAQRLRGGNAALSEKQLKFLTVALGIVLGVIVPLTSVGAGAMGVTILIMLYPKLAMKDVVGSDIVHAVPLTLVAGAGYWFLGGIQWKILALLLSGSVPGVILGSIAAPYVPERYLRFVLASVLGFVAIKLILI